MAAIKSFTSLEQSKVLSKILPLESADMRIGNYVGKYACVDGTNVHYYHKSESFGAPEIIPCWSLAALLDVLPDGTNIIKDKSDTENEKYMCTVAVTDDIISTFGNSSVNACVDMILRLKTK